MQRKFPTLCRGNLGVGADMTGIWNLLRSREQTGRWNYQFKGALRSALAGRQYTQSRCYAAGFATHKACLVCLYHLLPKNDDGGSERSGTIVTGDSVKRKRNRQLVDPDLLENPPDNILQQCPIGNPHHRAEERRAATGKKR